MRSLTIGVSLKMYFGRTQTAEWCRAVADMDEVRHTAGDLGIDLELGTRGVDPAHLHRYLDMAGKLGVKLVRSMLHTATHKPTTDEAAALLKEAMPAFENHGVSVALETYGQVHRPKTIVRDDWKKIFDDSELDKVITRMLRINQIDRASV